MVHQQGTLEVDGVTYVEVRNIPFEMIPPYMIEQMDLDIPLEVYYNLTGFLNRTSWNVCLYDNTMMKAVAWGCYWPVERIMVILRICLDKSVRHTLLLDAFIDVVLTFGEEMGADRAMCISDKYRSWLRLIKPKGELSDARLIERELSND